MYTPRRCAAILGVALAVLTAGPLGAAPQQPGAPPPSVGQPSSAVSSPPPAPAQIRQATQAVLAQGKYRRRPPPAQQWLQEKLQALLEKLVSWLERMGQNRALEQGANAVFYALVGVVVLATLGLVARLLLLRRRGPAPERRAPDPIRHRRVASPGDLQSQAAALAARGEYGPALRLLEQACLLALDRRGLLVVRSSATDGEYLRQLRSPPEARALLAELLALVEVYLYGGRALDREQYGRGEQSALALLRGLSAP